MTWSKTIPTGHTFWQSPWWLQVEMQKWWKKIVAGFRASYGVPHLNWAKIVNRLSTDKHTHLMGTSIFFDSNFCRLVREFGSILRHLINSSPSVTHQRNFLGFEWAPTVVSTQSCVGASWTSVGSNGYKRLQVPLFDPLLILSGCISGTRPSIEMISKLTVHRTCS